jgi:peroxiredoxin
MLLFRYIKVLAVAAVICGLLAAPAAAAPKGKGAGNVSFPGVLSESDQRYLGLNGTGSFNLSDIGAPLVVVEVMRTACPHCVGQVPGMNSLFRLVQKSDIKNKVRLLAVAQGCSASDVKGFRSRHKVAIPMLADPNGTVGKALGVSGVPTTVIMNRNGQILRTHVGNIGSPKKALAELRQLAQ